jgi:signal transduction histidine kinase
MNRTRAVARVVAAVLLAGVLPWLASLAAYLLFGDERHILEPLHGDLEMAGACIALAVAALLLLRLRYDPASAHLTWVAMGLVAMGLVDAVHSLIPFGVAFSWTRHGATLIGGLFLAMVWLPPAAAVRHRRRLVLAVALASVAAGFAVWRWREWLPAPWVAGRYTRLVVGANALGGLGFLAAAVFFLRRYLRGQRTEDMVFASHTLLFGAASLLFGFSHVWAADWWTWHCFRLLAYAIVLVAAHDTVVALYERIAGQAQELESRVQARVADLRRANEVLEGQIAERKRGEERLSAATAELQRSNRELEQFAYVASHDLQEPLRKVASFTQLLAERYGDRLDTDAREFIAYAVDGAHRMQGLINDLLAYSRVGTRGKPFAPVDCGAVVEYAVANLELAIRESGAVVTRERLPTVMGDDLQLVQVFQNLIGNAIKFRGAAPPRVHVSAAGTGEEWIFRVSDNGIGIDPQYFARLFVIFQRLHSRAEYAGSGIGLAISKKIVERHGGRIWVESEPGKGATFCFSVPDRLSGNSGARDGR